MFSTHPLRLNQVRQRGLMSSIGARTLVRDHLVEQRGVGRVDVAANDPGGVVHDGVELAEGSDRVGDQSLRDGGVGEVALREPGVGAQFATGWPRSMSRPCSMTGRLPHGPAVRWLRRCRWCCR